jgi:hypothetical protein
MLKSIRELEERIDAAALRAPEHANPAGSGSAGPTH